ncbi:MAG: hypothetical protein EON92_18575 [Burkholderiales bacterium]|nr:MAG: hypothetical protein EON92_18575 [Burkholderiales bacterium]
MIDSFIQTARLRAADTAHYERFAASHAPAIDGAFTLRLVRDGRCPDVPIGRVVLDLLLDAGRATNEYIIPCCSGWHSQSLVEEL